MARSERKLGPAILSTYRLARLMIRDSVTNSPLLALAQGAAELAPDALYLFHAAFCRSATFANAIDSAALPNVLIRVGC